MCVCVRASRFAWWWWERREAREEGGTGRGANGAGRGGEAGVEGVGMPHFVLPGQARLHRLGSAGPKAQSFSVMETMVLKCQKHSQ